MHILWDIFQWSIMKLHHGMQFTAHCGLVIPRDGWHRSGSTLAQVMAWGRHYLNRCWLIVNGLLWHPPKTNFAGSAQKSKYQFVKLALKVHLWNYFHISAVSELIPVYHWNAIQWSICRHNSVVIIAYDCAQIPCIATTPSYQAGDWHGWCGQRHYRFYQEIT